jgi:chloramphenicol O-acetyltransferase type A
LDGDNGITPTAGRKQHQPMKRKLNIDEWERKDHFHFFNQFEEPFFGICLNVEVSRAYAIAKASGISFFLYYLYQSLKAANAVAPFKYRIIDEDVFVYDTVHASPTINRPDGSFGFSYMDYYADFETFERHAKTAIEQVQKSKGLVPAISGENVIHYSSIPWINFTALSHARSFRFKDTCPKISFGKMTEENGKKMMPVSIHAHHALMDGFHVGQFIELFQQYLNT